MLVSDEFKKEFEKEMKMYINNDKTVVNLLNKSICNYKRKIIISNGKIINGYNYEDVHFHMNKEKIKPQDKTKRKYDAAFEYIKDNCECYSDLGYRYNTGTKGIYFIVATEKIEFNIYDAYKYFIKVGFEKDDISLTLMPTPKINITDSENVADQVITIKKGELIYVGESKKLASRITEHESDKLNGTGSMKLGIRSSIFRNKYKIYTVKVENDEDRSFYEKFIRNAYIPVFGK